MIHILARLTFKTETVDAACEILLKLVQASRQEVGCIAYDMYQRSDAPHEFRTVEQWTSQAAVDAHMKSAHLAAAIAAASAMFTAPPEIVTFEKLL